MVYLYRHHVGLSQCLYNKISDDVKLESELVFLFCILNNLHGCIFASKYTHGLVVSRQIYTKNTSVKNFLCCIRLRII